MSSNKSSTEKTQMKEVETVPQNDARDKDGVDEALGFTVEHDEITWTQEEEMRVKRKIDTIVLPLLFFAALFSYADSQVFGFSAIFGMIQDLKLYTVDIVGGEPVSNTQKYSFTAGIPNLGAVVSAYPLMLLAQHLSAGKFLGVMAIFAGVCNLLVVACRNFSDLMALRFFYGFQYMISSLCVIVTTMWWKTNEQPLRIGAWVGGAAIGNLIGQAIDFGGIEIKGAFAASPWKWLYIILGTAALASGIILLVALPATPMKAWFLTERERTIAVKRLIKNHTGIQTKTIKWKHVKEALLDPQFWVFNVFSFAFSFANNAGGSFGGLLATSFGYTPKRALIILMPASAVAIVCIYGAGFLLTKFHHRRILIAICFLLPTIIGNAILWKAPRDNIHALLAGLYMAQIFYGAFISVSSLISSNVGGHTKKTTVNAISGIFSACGGFAGPWAYIGSEAAQGYPTGQASTMALMAVSCVALGGLWFHYIACNRRKEAFIKEHAELVIDPEFAFHDLTDKENPVFCYAY